MAKDQQYIVIIQEYGKIRFILFDTLEGVHDEIHYLADVIWNGDYTKTKLDSGIKYTNKKGDFLFYTEVKNYRWYGII